MTSVIRGDDDFDSSEAVSGTAKAWVNFDGSGTVSIRESFNVSSITDEFTGAFTINFTNAMTDANYAMAQMARQSPNATYAYPDAVPSSASETPKIFARAEGVGLRDAEFVSVIVFR